MNKISLQTKTIVIISTLILSITVILTTIFSYLQFKETEIEIGTRALDVATTVSLMPAIKDAFETKNPEEIIQPIADEVRSIVEAEFVVVGNNESIRYAHPDTNKIGKKMVGGDNDRALIDQEYYTSRAKGSLGPSLRGKAPIFNDQGEVLGVVSVGFLVKDIKSIIWNRTLKISGIAFGVLLLGIFGGIFLARNIRKDTFGLEPHEIASLYRDRNAILSSIKEGIIAIDQHGNINMINDSAKNILGLSDNKNYKIEDVVPNTKMYDVLSSGQPIRDEEMLLNNRTIIVNRTPIKSKDDKVVGVVSSFRDKTEINEMLTTLYEIRSYSEGLRAQTHEYTNKMYVLSGLLQLGQYNEAIDIIQQESEINMKQNKILMEKIKDKTVQAILLGKISKCSEMKIDFIIDKNTYLDRLPKHFNAMKLITILGNLIDNAIEAVGNCDKKEINFFATDIGNDIVLEVADSGKGITNHEVTNIFKQGYSTKQKEHRGYGLSIVKQSVEELHGEIELHRSINDDTVFTVFFPKELHNEGRMANYD